MCLRVWRDSLGKSWCDLFTDLEIWIAYLPERVWLWARNVWVLGAPGAVVRGLVAFGIPSSRTGL